MQIFPKGSPPTRRITKIRWEAKLADQVGNQHEDASSREAREAVNCFVKSAQLRATAERMTGGAARLAQHEAYVAAEAAVTSLDKAQRHSAQAGEQRKLAAHLRLIIAVEELDDYGGASASTDAPLTFSIFRPIGALRPGLSGISYGDAS